MDLKAICHAHYLSEEVSSIANFGLEPSIQKVKLYRVLKWKIFRDFQSVPTLNICSPDYLLLRSIQLLSMGNQGKVTI